MMEEGRCPLMEEVPLDRGGEVPLDGGGEVPLDGGGEVPLDAGYVYMYVQSLSRTARRILFKNESVVQITVRLLITKHRTFHWSKYVYAPNMHLNVCLILPMCSID